MNSVSVRKGDATIVAEQQTDNPRESLGEHARTGGNGMSLAETLLAQREAVRLAAGKLRRN